MPISTMNYRRKVIFSLRAQPALLREVIQNNVNTVERLLNEDASKCIFSDQNRRTPLHMAASLGRTEIVDLFLSADCYSVNFRDSELVTPLHRACRNNHPETVEKLMQHNADPNARSRLHITPLHVCSSFNALECARIIVEAVSNINATDSSGTTALHYAVFHNNLPMIELLLAHGAQAEVQDKQGRRPIHYAAITNSADAIRMLVEAGCDVNVRNRDWLTPLHVAIAHKHYEAFIELLKHEANLEAQDFTGNMPAHWAAFMGCDKIFAEIMQRVSIMSSNLNGVTPLHYACSTHNGDGIAVKIMDSISDVDVVDKLKQTPLHFAAMNGREKTATELIARGANCNFGDINLDTPLHKATQNCHANMLALLLKNGAGIDTPNKDGFTPLHLAMIAGLPWNCELLIKAGANPFLCDCSGRTAHFLAVYKGTFDCLLSLVSSPHYSLDNLGNSDFKVFPALDAFDRSLLHYAAASNTCSHDFIEFLLLRRRLNTIANLPPELNTAIEGAFQLFDINKRDIYGRTPLHYVCLRESMDMDSDTPFLVEMFLESGADNSILDNDNRLPFHYAVANGYNSVLDLLFKKKWLENRADYVRYFSKCCPLKAACYYGNCSAINKLLEYGFRSYDQSIEIATKRGHWNCVLKLKNFITSRQLFHKLALISAYNGHSNGLRIFLGCNSGMDLEDIFFMAAASRDGTACLEVLLEKRVNLHIRNRQGRNALFYAVLGGNFESVRFLLSSGIRLVRDCLGKTVFHLIASKGDFEMFRLFHQLSKDHGFYGHICTYLLTKDDDGFCPIEVACLRGHQAILEYYLATMNKGFEQKLMYFAGFTSNRDFIEHLYKKNGAAFVNLIGPNKRTLLHYCCMAKRSNLPLLKLLIDQLNFDVHFMDANNYTPLLCTASVGNASALEYLLENTQSNIMATDIEGNTVLHLACHSGNSNCALTVIRIAEKQKVLDELIMAKNDLKQTPLHLAALKSLTHVVNYLLEYGANVSDLDSYDYTPSMYCSRDPRAAYCLNMIQMILEMDCKLQSKPEDTIESENAENEESPEPNETTGNSKSKLATCSMNRISLPYNTSQLRSQSMNPDWNLMMENRFRRLSSRFSLQSSTCDSELSRFSSKGSLKEAAAHNRSTIEECNEAGEDEHSAVKSEIQKNGDQQSTPTDEECSNGDTLVDSDPDMF